MANLPVASVGQYVQFLQIQIQGMQHFLDSKFVPPDYNLDMEGQPIEGTSSVETKQLILNEVPTPAAPPVNKLAVFSDGTDVKTIDSDGTVQTLQTVSGSTVYLPLAGGTMTGSIAMGTNNITNVGTLSGATNSRTADNIVSNAGASTSGDVAVFSGVSGKVITDSGIVSTDLVTNTGASVAGNVATFSGVSGKVITDSGASLSQYLPLSGGTMTGSIALGTNNLTNVGTLSGASNSRTADNIVSNAGASVAGNVATFSGVSGKIITDSGASLSQYLPLAGGTMSGAIAMGTNNITNVGTLSGATNSRTADNIVSNTGTSTSGDVAVFSGATGKVITDTSIVSANLVTNAGASVAGNVATFSGVSGKIITDSGASLSQYLPLAGGTMSGAIAMGTNNITNVGTLSGATNSRTADNIVSNAGASVAGNVATFSGVTGKVITDSGASLSQYLPLAGGTMSGAIAMGTNNITNVGTLSGATNSRTADNIVSNAGASVAGNVATFSGVTGKVIADSGASLSQYLPLAGGTMTGTLTFSDGTAYPTNRVYAKYSSYRIGTFVTNTTTQTTLLAGGSSTGSLTWAAGSTQAGTHIKMYGHVQIASIVNTELLTFSITVDGTTVWSITYTNGSGVDQANLIVWLDIKISLAATGQNGFVIGTYSILLPAGANATKVNNGTIISGAPGWDHTASHTVDLTATWTTANVNNQVAKIQFLAEQAF